MKQDRHFTTTCLSKRRIAPGVYELRFKKPETLAFIAGQFLLFDVPLAGKPDDIQPRAYSIASTPTENDLLFVIKLVPNGRAHV
jgi:ferredoxin-NADP reductase